MRLKPNSAGIRLKCLCERVSKLMSKLLTRKVAGTENYEFNLTLPNGAIRHVLMVILLCVKPQLVSPPLHSLRLCCCMLQTKTVATINKFNWWSYPLRLQLVYSLEFPAVFVICCAPHRTWKSRSFIRCQEIPMSKLENKLPPAWGTRYATRLRKC